MAAPARRQPPVMKDKGYVYVVPVIIDARGNKRPPRSLGTDYTALYGVVAGVEYAVIRRPDAIESAQADVQAAQVLIDAFAKGVDTVNLGRIKDR